MFSRLRFAPAGKNGGEGFAPLRPPHSLFQNVKLKRILEHDCFRSDTTH